MHRRERTTIWTMVYGSKDFFFHSTVRRTAVTEENPTPVVENPECSQALCPNQWDCRKVGWHLGWHRTVKSAGTCSLVKDRLLSRVLIIDFPFPLLFYTYRTRTVVIQCLATRQCLHTGLVSFSQSRQECARVHVRQQKALQPTQHSKQQRTDIAFFDAFSRWMSFFRKKLRFET